jgi:probable O-glycosylation ligase (exosortase A-associated)
MRTGRRVLDLFLFCFFAGLLGLSVRRPFIAVLAYLYVDIVAPQRISYFLLASIPISLITFVAAFGGWMLADDKRDARFSGRQTMLLILLCYAGVTTLMADFPVEAADKWAWVWKALLFAIFLPLTLRTRLRIEAVVLFMVLSAGSIIITGAIKTLATGGGYGSLRFFVSDNTGLYEGSIISCVAVAIIPLILWLGRFGTIYPRSAPVRLFCVALVFACLLIPVGTQARTGLLCIALLGGLLLRASRHRLLFLIGAVAVIGIAVPFLPDSYTKRMNTIENHGADQSASTRLAVWAWTIDYAKDHPFGGGFDSYRSNHVMIETTDAETSGASTDIETTVIADQSRAFHSAYFEMLGEQGWPGLILWLALQISGLWQMERIRNRWRRKAALPGAGPDQQWQAPLANALQQAQLVYLLGAAFVGIAYQPFILMLIGLQCGLHTYLKRVETPDRPVRQAAAMKPLAAEG